MASVEFTNVKIYASDNVFAPSETIDVGGTININSSYSVSSFKCYLMSNSNYCATVPMSDSFIIGLKSASATFYCIGKTLGVEQQAGTGTNLYTYMNSQNPKVRNAPINRLRAVITFSNKTTFQTDVVLSGTNGRIAIDARRKPEISKMWFNRCNSEGVKDNEGESVLATIKTSFSSSGYSTAYNLTLKQYDKSDNSLVETVVVSDSESLAELYNGITDDDMFISSFTFSKSKNYYIEAELGDVYEKSTLRCAVPGSFVNVHLSSANNGGVSLGKYSGSTDANPLFESNYNAVLYKDLEVKQNVTIVGQITSEGQIVGNGNIHLIDGNGNNKFWVGISDGSVGIYGDTYASGSVDALRVNARESITTNSLTANNITNLQKGLSAAKSISGSGFASWIINFSVSYKSGTTPYVVATPYIGDVVSVDGLVIAINTVNNSYFKITVYNNGSASQTAQISWMAFGEF